MLACLCSRLLSAFKCFCVTFIVIVGIYQVESLPACKAAAQDKATNSQASPAIKSALGSAESPVAGNNTTPAADKIKRSEWVQIAINAFIALVILWQAWIYNQQRKAARIAERGYIGIATIDLVDLVPGLRAHVAVCFLNGGRTPVWHFQAPAALKLGVEPPGEETDPPPRFEPQEEGFLPAGAGTTMRYKFPDETTERRILRIAHGERQIFLWGTAYFEDCWGERRTFPFKMIYNPDDGRFEEYKGYEIW
jgi:hypothetical protein